MTTKYIIFILISISVIFDSSSQSEWQANRKPYPVNHNDEHSLRSLFRSIHYDYKYVDGEFICDITYHNIFKVTNDDALEGVNRIHIPMGNVIEILDIQSRTISSEGKIIELDQNNIKEVEDEDSKGGYKIFAVEGAEVGGEIEYRYTKRINGRVFVNETIQFNAPTDVQEFTLTCPENLVFEFSIANDTNEVIQVDSSEAYNKYQVVLRDIPSYQAEGFSGFEACLKRIDFKLAYNSNYGNRRLNTYSDGGKVVYDEAHDISNKERKLIDNFIDKHLPKNTDPIERLKVLEHEFKSKYYEEEGVPKDLEFLFTNGFGHKEAFLKFFIAVVEYLHIDYEIVATSNRFEKKFNPNFDSWNFLENYMLYFPKENQFMSAHSFTDRYGSVPASQTATKGIFIQPELITDFIYPITRMDYIPAPAYKQNMNNIEMDISFDEELSKANVLARRIYQGDEAGFYKSTMIWMDQEQVDEMLDEMVEYLSPGAENISVEVAAPNNTTEDWQKPLVIACNFETEDYLEQAGSSILFRVGQVIGAQSEMYQEEQRVYDVENTNNRGYRREISINIPEGYSFRNLEDIKLREAVSEDGEDIFLFEADYALDGNRLVITIDEYYNRIYFPRESFEDFRRVINAAADWNKVVLVLKEG